MSNSNLIKAFGGLFSGAAVTLAVLLVAPELRAQEGLVLEEVIVTAQKREESVQDIPSTVNALSGDAIQEYNITNFKDLQQLTPGLSLLSLDARNNSISLRGISYDPDSAAGDTVVTYWNGTPVRANVSFNDMFDMARVEVLRGPQGTLQGETSPAGSIQLHTRKPDLSLVESQFQHNYSEDSDGGNTQFGISLPLAADTLGLRIAGLRSSSNLDQSRNETTDTDQQGDTTAGRLTLLWEPTDTFDATLTGEYLEFGAFGFETVEGPGSLNDSGQPRPLLTPLDRVTLSEQNGEIRRKHGLATLNLNWELGGNRLTFLGGYQNLLNFAIRDVDRANFTAMQQDSDPELEHIQLQTVDTGLNVATAELRLTSLDPDAWEYIFGLFYRDSNSNTLSESQRVIFGRHFGVRIVVPVDQENVAAFSHHKFHFSEKTELQLGLRWQSYNRFNRSDNIGTYAVPAIDDFVFGGATVPLATPLQPGDRLTPQIVAESISIDHLFVGRVQAGIQASFEAMGCPAVPQINFSGGPCPPGLAAQLAAQAAPAQAFQQALAIGNNFADVEYVPPESVRGKADVVTGSLRLSNRPNPDLLLYVAYDRGYRPAGASININGLEADEVIYDEEFSDIVEFGLKADLLEGRMVFNAALFQQQFDGFISRTRPGVVVADLQMLRPTASAALRGPDGCPLPTPAAAQLLTAGQDGCLDTPLAGGLVYNGDAVVQGLDLEFTALVSEYWTFFAGISYSNAEFDGTVLVPCSDVAHLADGKQVARCPSTGGRIGPEPELSMSLRSEWAIPLPLAGSEFFVRALYKYNDKRLFERLLVDGQSRDDETDAFGQLDFYMGWKGPERAWNLSFWVKNLTDEEVQTAYYGEENQADSYRRAQALAPRTAGITVGYGF